LCLHTMSSILYIATNTLCPQCLVVRIATIAIRKRIVERDNRRNKNPKFHYGTIGSANTMVEDASQPTTSTTTYTRPTTTESSGSTLLSIQPTATVTDSSLASGPSLSRAGKIGVGIDVPLAFLAIATVLLFLILRIKRSRCRNQERDTGRVFEKPELANTQIESFGPTELPISSIGKIFANNAAGLKATGPSPNMTHGNAM
jgi:hypothetical protein